MGLRERNNRNARKCSRIDRPRNLHIAVVICRNGFGVNMPRYAAYPNEHPHGMMWVLKGMKYGSANFVTIAERLSPDALIAMRELMLKPTYKIKGHQVIVVHSPWAITSITRR